MVTLICFLLSLFGLTATQEGNSTLGCSDNKVSSSIHWPLPVQGTAPQCQLGLLYVLNRTYLSLLNGCYQNHNVLIQ